MWNLLKAELLKLRRCQILWVGLVALALCPLVQYGSQLIVEAEYRNPNYDFSTLFENVVWGNTANYEDFSDTEYLFGGTSIKREAGKDLSIDCALEVTDGTAKVFWISGADEEVTLLETTGTYSDTITLPEGGNYIGIECENFTGSIELNME